MKSEIKKIGFIMGGQLARMMINAIGNWNTGFEILALSPSADCPAAHVGAKVIEGSASNYEDVLAFGRDLDVVVLEFEHVNTEALAALEAEGVKVYVAPRILEIIKNKGKQKQFFVEHGISTAKFELVEGAESLMTMTDKLPFVQKSCELGYDGGGVKVMRNEADLAEAITAPSLIEDLIDYETELSVIIARTAEGEMVTYPVVEQQFVPGANLVEFIAAPARISKEIAADAEAIARKVVEAFDFVGLMAVELFLTKEGELLVNEVAPRVHNSGHHTIEANQTSQFEQYMRLVLGLPLGSVKTYSPAVTVNVLGDPAHTGEAYYEGLEEVMEMDDVYVHLYGKMQTKPYRKMGHVTVLAGSIEEAWQKAQQVQSILKVITK